MLKSFLADPQIHAALMNILAALAAGIGALLGVLIRRGAQLLSAKFHNEHNVVVAALADRLVKYAEQTFAEKANNVKSDYVAGQLARQFPSLSSQEIQHFMEQAVVNMQTAMTAPQVNMNMNVTTPPAAPAGELKGGTPS